MTTETLGWIFVFLIWAYMIATFKWVFLDRVREIKDIAKNENVNGDGI